MTRRRLPNRRRSVTSTLTHGNITYSVSIGFDDQARPKELFARAVKPDSDADLVADDVGVLISLALQYGVDPRQLAHSVARHDGAPTSIVGRLIDRLAEESE